MLLVDTADPQEISAALRFHPIQGFTTNPNLIARAADLKTLTLSDYVTRARVLCRLTGREEGRRIRHVMIQGVGNSAQIREQAALYVEDMKSAAEAKLWIKIVPTHQSLACCHDLKKLGCSVLVTAIFTAAQAYLARESGADGVAVYVGRLMRLEEIEWAKIMEKISRIMGEAEKTLLLASFPDAQSVEVALGYSRDLTLPLKILEEIYQSPHSQQAIVDFDNKIKRIN